MGQTQFLQKFDLLGFSKLQKDLQNYFDEVILLGCPGITLSF